MEEEEEEELEEDDDSLAGKSQDDTASPTPEPQGAYEDDEDEEPPTSLAVGFDHTRRWAPALCGPQVLGPQAGRRASTEGVGYRPWGCRESDMTEGLNTQASPRTPATESLGSGMGYSPSCWAASPAAIRKSHLLPAHVSRRRPARARWAEGAAAAWGMGVQTAPGRHPPPPAPQAEPASSASHPPFPRQNRRLGRERSWMVCQRPRVSAALRVLL